jgi:hypothetical protein
MNNSIFSQIAINNNLTAAELDEIVNNAFEALQEEHNNLSITYLEDGVYLHNFEDLTEEETGGLSKEEIENALTDELISIINNLI